MYERSTAAWLREIGRLTREIERDEIHLAAKYARRLDAMRAVLDRGDCSQGDVCTAANITGSTLRKQLSKGA